MLYCKFLKMIFYFAFCRLADIKGGMATMLRILSWRKIHLLLDLILFSVGSSFRGLLRECISFYLQKFGRARTLPQTRTHIKFPRKFGSLKTKNRCKNVIHRHCFARFFHPSPVSLKGHIKMIKWARKRNLYVLAK